VPYFAAAATRAAKTWAAAELDLNGAADVEEIADRLRDTAAEADLSLLFVESDDAYLVILRLDEGEDLRIFGSDSVFADESRLGALLLGDIKEPALEIDDVIAGPASIAVADPAETAEVDEPPAATPDIEPVGDPDLLTDLGIPAHRLLELCAQEGMLPADITAELCQTIGCGDEVEELREA
jgi:putative tRNA adenosine deaminase-associated protein